MILKELDSHIKYIIYSILVKEAPGEEKTIDKTPKKCKINGVMLKNQPKIPQYSLDAGHGFQINDFNHAKPFANFFPGIAGKYGIPMWVFFVNRGQGIASFGTKDKDHAILEFFPANKAWQNTSLQGFRTFLKVYSGNKFQFYEPFHNGFCNLKFNLSNCMNITSYDLELIENNFTLGLQIKVKYFTVPNDSYAALARIVTIKNISKTAKKIHALDGLPQIVPFGINNWLLKEMSRTIEAWITVDNLRNNAPLFRLKVDPADRPEVVHIEEGNFYLGFHFKGKKSEILSPLIDPNVIFGSVTDFSCPHNFLTSNTSLNTKNKAIIESKTPSAFSELKFTLNPGKEKQIYSLIGYARTMNSLNKLLPKVTKSGYLETKARENKLIIETLEQDVETKTSSQALDLYTKQTYLDNILRGGYPIIFKSGQNQSLFHVFSRKHGDLERDYNRFSLQPAYFSQGNGNYRDVNQNRRLDNWFNAQVKAENILDFFNLLQTDGFNPLVVKGVTFLAKPSQGLELILKECVENEHVKLLSCFIGKPFTPGDLCLFIQENQIKLKLDIDDFLNRLLANCQRNQEAEHGEGFWIDHWTYNLDLLDAYLAIYPDERKKLLFEKKEFTYFDNTEVVRPRQEKYVLYNGSPRQLHSLILDGTKKEMIRKRASEAHVVRSNFGEGEIYHTTLINKLFCLLANKAASLDPSGVGIEMEANKPDWYDALNGLPALFGSSLSETFELKRLILFLQESLGLIKNENLRLTEEVGELLRNVNQSIEGYFKSSDENKDFILWDNACSQKENFRRKTLFGLSGNDKEISVAELNAILNNILQKVDSGIDRAFDEKTGLYYTYFINEVADYEILDKPFIKPLKFIQKKIPFFLESQMHALRLTHDLGQAQALYQAVKRSELFDKALKMYKVTSSLKEMPEEIGRCRAFPPGWLENESIWLHMEYKYLLEVLKLGLYEEFYADFKNVLIPFQNPAQYGRSILENSSFIVGSAFSDKSLHGNGFVARLSGSTVEYLQIWLVMNIGKSPFFLDAKAELNLKFDPHLAGWLFDKETKTYSFTFLSKIKVIYHNLKLKNTFGRDGVSIKKVNFLDAAGKAVEIKSNIIPSIFAQQIRSCRIKQIDITLD